MLCNIILENNIHHYNYQCKRDRVSDGVCKKGFPKDFLENLYLDEEEYYALYKRRKNGGQTFLMFIDARGGCGKTFLLNTVLAAVR